MGVSCFFLVRAFEYSLNIFNYCFLKTLRQARYSFLYVSGHLNMNLCMCVYKKVFKIEVLV